MNLLTLPSPLSGGAPRWQNTSYIHYRTFFQGDRWSAHDLVGELLARGITQMAIADDAGDITVAWREATPPNVIGDAEKTPA